MLRPFVAFEPQCVIGFRYHGFGQLHCFFLLFQTPVPLFYNLLILQTDVFLRLLRLPHALIVIIHHEIPPMRFRLKHRLYVHSMPVFRVIGNRLPCMFLVAVFSDLVSAC
jgi:hypothetical protein